MAEDKMAKNMDAQLNPEDLENVSGGMLISELTKGCIVHLNSERPDNDNQPLGNQPLGNQPLGNQPLNLG